MHALKRSVVFLGREFLGRSIACFGTEFDGNAI